MKRGLSRVFCFLSARADTARRRDWLRPKDHPVIAAWLLLSAVAIAGSWMRAGGLRGGLVSIDAAPVVTHPDRIDINRAEWPELTLLPGISRVMAERIVKHRQEKGPFGSVEDLRQVSGIGPKTVARMRPFVDAQK